MADKQFVYEVKIDAQTAQAAARRLRDIFAQEMAQAGSGASGQQAAQQQQQAARAAAQAAIEFARQQTTQVRGEQTRQTAIVRAETAERTAAARAEGVVVAETARQARIVAEQEQRRLTAATTAEIRKREREERAAAQQAARASGRQFSIGGALGGINGLLGLATGGIAGYAAVQAGQALYGAGREGASQERTLLVLQQTAERMGVSAQALQNAITTAGRGTISQSGAQSFALQLLSQRWAPSRDNIAGDAGLLAEAGRLFSQRYATSEGQAMTSTDVLGRFMGYIREGNKELVDQFGINNALIAQKAGVPNENLTAEDRARGLFVFLEEEIGRLADVADTSIEQIETAESRFANAMDRIKQSLAGPTAAAATWVADQIALFDAQRGASDLQETRTAVTAISQPTPIDDFSFSRQADLQAAEQYLAVAEQYDNATKKNEEAARAYAAQLNVLGQAITTQNGLTAEQYTQLNELSVRLKLVEDGTDAWSAVTSNATQAQIENNTEVLAIARAMAAYEEMLVNGQLTMEQYIVGLTRLTGHLADVAAQAGVTTGAIGRLTRAASIAAGMDILDAYGVDTGGIAGRIRTRDIADSAAGFYRGGRGSVNPLTGEVVADKGDRGKAGDPLDQLQQSVDDYQEQAAAKAARAYSSAADKTAKAFEQAAEDAAGAFRDALGKVPGLFGTSSVTAQDMADAEAGVYQPKADEYLRQLRDEVLNGKDYAGVDLADIAGVAGIDQSLSPEAQLRQVERMWDDSSLFANPDALRFVNQDAIKSYQAQEAASAAGKENLYAMFGMGPDSPLTPEQRTAFAEMTGTEGRRIITGADGAAMALTIGGQQRQAASVPAEPEQQPPPPPEPSATSATSAPFLEELLAGLDPSQIAGETLKTLEALGSSIFGAIFTGYESAAGEAEWSDPVVAGLVEQVLPGVLQALEGEI